MSSARTQRLSVTAPALAAPVPVGRPVRVALVISALSDGGSERVVCALAGYWSRAGHEVSVVTVSSRETDRYELPAGVARASLDLAHDSRNIVEGVLRASRRVAALRRALRRFQPEVVVSFLARTNVLSLVATRGMGIPVFACERSDPRREPVGAPWAALRRVLYPRATGVVVQTDRVATWARAFCPRVHVIPNFVERPAMVAKPGQGAGPKQLLAMGRLAPEKGFDLLLQAFALAAPARPDWSLVIVGEGAERSSLEALVARLRLQGRVKLPGRTSDPASYLAASHLFALPSRYEGFPNALLEAMASGLPVVAFDCDSGPAEIVAHDQNGLLVSAADVAGLATALGRLMDSPEERVKLGLGAREITTTLGADRILDLWSTILSAAGA